jgi:hypothetical protein
MAVRHRVLLLFPLALAGCGPLVDDPGNAPLRGRWQRESKLLALIANDVWVDRKDVPFKLPEDETVVKECFEPKLKTSDEINDDMLKGNRKMCSFGEIARKGGTFTSSGTCGPQEKSGGTISGTIELTGREAADRAEGKVSATLLLKTRDGASQRVRFGVETKWKRLGDCGSKGSS